VCDGATSLALPLQLRRKPQLPRPLRGSWTPDAAREGRGLRSLLTETEQIQLHHADVVAAVAEMQICNLKYRRSFG
jgi:hypothetical protein